MYIYGVSLMEMSAREMRYADTTGGKTEEERTAVASSDEADGTGSDGTGDASAPL